MFKLDVGEMMSVQYVHCMHWILLYAVDRHSDNLFSSRTGDFISVPVRGRVLRSDWPSAEVCRGVCSCVRMIICAAWRRFRAARESCSCSLTAAEVRDESRLRLCVCRTDINALSLQWSRWQHRHRLTDASTRDVWRALAAAAEGDSVFVFVSQCCCVNWRSPPALPHTALFYSILFYSILFYSILFSVVLCSFLLYVLF